MSLTREDKLWIISVMKFMCNFIIYSNFDALQVQSWRSHRWAETNQHLDDLVGEP